MLVVLLELTFAEDELAVFVTLDMAAVDFGILLLLELLLLFLLVLLMASEPPSELVVAASSCLAELLAALALLCCCSRDASCRYLANSNRVISVRYNVNNRCNSSFEAMVKAVLSPNPTALVAVVNGLLIEAA